MNKALLKKISSAFLLLMLVLMGGCGGKRILSEPNITWPPAPEAPRIRFIKTISSSEDVEEKTALDKFKAFLVGGDSAAMLVKPYAVHAGPEGRLYVADSGWRKVLVFDQNKKSFSMLGVDGPGALAGPLGVTVDKTGRVYVTDTVHKKCLVYDAAGKHLFNIGDENRMERPVGIAVNDALKRIYIADTRKHLVFVFDLEGKFLFEFGGRGTGDGQLNFPANLFIDGKGVVYVTDMNFRVQLFDAEGKFLSKFGSVGTGFGQFSLPKGVGVDSKGHIYVVDARFNNVQIFNQEGRLLLFFGSFGQRKGQFWLPAGLSIDDQNRIYVADQYNHRIDVFQYLEPSTPTSMSEETGMSGAGAPSAPSGSTHLLAEETLSGK